MTEPSSPESDLRETLVAYLDGELSAEDERRVEQLLSADNGVRQELQRLQSTWDLLDRLPKAELGASFTRSTVEMVALSVEHDLGPRSARKLGRLPLALAAVAAAAALAFLVARVWPGRNQQLLRDLPLVEHLEAYRQTPDMEFLRKLERSRVFGLDTSPPEASTDEQRQARIDGLPVDRKEELLRRFERLEKLPAAEQHRLRQLDADLQRDSNARQLHAVLRDYQQWLDQLAGFERAELMALPAERRLARIKQLRGEEERQLSAEDQAVFAQWVEEKVLARMTSAQRQRFTAPTANLPENRRRQELGKLLRAMMQAARSKQTADKSPGARPRPKPRSFWNAAARQELAERLSPLGRRQLDDAGDEAAQRKLVQSWAREVFLAPAGGRDIKLPSLEINNARLKQFFEQEVNSAERAHLLSLPSDQMQRQLQRLYLQAHPK
ncbi:MAG TPA: hypothetical protein VFW87_12405 [Pirellulales bacterium]|nr:hypothetical protein [Pirellulales bacterium]